MAFSSGQVRTSDVIVRGHASWPLTTRPQDPLTRAIIFQKGAASGVGTWRAETLIATGLRRYLHVLLNYKFTGKRFKLSHVALSVSLSFAPSSCLIIEL